LTDGTLQRAESVIGWELRGALASGRVIRLVLSERCDGVAANDQGIRLLEGQVQRVAATDAFCVVQGRHVPLSDVRAVVKPHYSQGAASDPADPMDHAADYTDAPLRRRPR
jgi:hypothetical protein